MGDYIIYKNAVEAINLTIVNKESEIKDIEDEIFYLKKSRRMMDDEFKKGNDEKESYLG